jgi:hypothetical protein
MGTENYIFSHPALHRSTCCFGGARRDRTADLLHAMQALSQLSYSPKEGVYSSDLTADVKLNFSVPCK